MRKRLTVVGSGHVLTLIVISLTLVFGTTSPTVAYAAQKGPDPVQSSVTVDRTAAAADGAVTVHITITARDSKGHPVPKWNASVLVAGEDHPNGEGNTVVQPGETDKRGVATAQLRSTTSETKTIFVTLAKQGATVALAQHPQVEFVAVQAIRVMAYQSQVETGGNCFLLDREENMPASPVGAAWNSSSAQPRGGYTTWLRAFVQSSDAPHDWQDVTGRVSWSVLDQGGTGTTFDSATGRVTTGAGAGTVHFAASLLGLTSPTDDGVLRVADAILTNIRINPADDADATSASFGPDPLYVPSGGTAPAGVTGSFTGAEAGGYCITWDTSLSSNQSNVAAVDANGVVTGVSPGTATLTARKGSTLSDTIPVNVGAAEVRYVEVSPFEVSIAVDGTAQLHALAHYTDGSSMNVTTNPATTWVLDPVDNVLQVDDGVSPGLVSNAGAGVAGQSDRIRACFSSDFIRPDGAPGTGKTCSDPSFNEDDAPQELDADGVPVNRNAVVEIG
jgi:Bacterial Ig-like domain (group 1)